MTFSFQEAVRKANELRVPYMDHDFRHELQQTLFKQKSATHPIFNQLGQLPDQLTLLRRLTLQVYQLTNSAARYIGALYNHCPIKYYRKRLAVSLYEAETGMLSKTANHKMVMLRFIHALGVSDEVRDSTMPLASTKALIDYRWDLVNNPDAFHMGVASVLIATEGFGIEQETDRARHRILEDEYGLKQRDQAFFSGHADEGISQICEGLDCVAEICKTRQMKDEALQAIRHTYELFWRMYDDIQDMGRHDNLQHRA